MTIGRSWGATDFHWRQWQASIRRTTARSSGSDSRNSQQGVPTVTTDIRPWQVQIRVPPCILKTVRQYAASAMTVSTPGLPRLSLILIIRTASGFRSCSGRISLWNFCWLRYSGFSGFMRSCGGERPTGRSGNRHGLQAMGVKLILNRSWIRRHWRILT